MPRIGFALGGEAGSRFAQADGSGVSPRTLLRLVRQVPAPAAGPVTMLGVDDWAKRRGGTYGTILVNLRTHRVIDLLPDRAAATFAAWLVGHPEVQVMSRDRGGAYAEDARLGAPQARQVADRIHLRKNVTDALMQYLTHKQPAVRQAAGSQDSAGPTGGDGPPEPKTSPALATRSARLSDEARMRRHTRYDEVMAFHAQGYSASAIATMTHLSRGTARTFLRADCFPERQPLAPRPTLLATFAAYLRGRWAAGCQNATRLWHELCRHGYTGGRARVAEYVRRWRRRPPPTHHGQATLCAQRTTPTYGPRQTTWLLLRPVETLTAAESAYMTHLYHVCPEVAVVEALVEEFAAVLRMRDVAGLYAWFHGVPLSGISELRGGARGMGRTGRRSGPPSRPIGAMARSNRWERRTFQASPALTGYLDWPGRTQVIRLERQLVEPRTGKARLEGSTASPAGLTPPPWYACYAATGPSRTAHTGSAMSPTTRAAPRPAPAPSPRSWRPCRTWPSASSVSPASLLSPRPPVASLLSPGRPSH